jgi:FkbM family methyltransferase
MIPLWLLREEIRMFLWRRGFDIVRRFRLADILFTKNIDVVVDVGANEGQFGTQIRRLGYQGKIISFEPSQTSFRRLQQRTAEDRNWRAFCVGLGAKREERDLNVAAESVFSSFLDSVRDSEVSGLSGPSQTQRVLVERLDSLLPGVCDASDRLFLKTDTQGFDHQVLAGAAGILGQVEGIQIELSLKPFYRGQPSIDETIELLRGKGFALWSIQPVFTDRHTGRMREVDGIFWRE